MFIEPRYRQSAGQKIYFSDKTRITGDGAEAWMNDRVPSLCVGTEGTLCETVCVSNAVPAEISEKIPGFVADEQGFVLSVGTTTYVYAGKKAVHSAFATLWHLCREGDLRETLLWDMPVGTLRGYRLFVPAREQIDLFKQTVDMLELYRFNAVILEIGAAMEYKSHPEINEFWVKYCADVRSKSGRSLEIQERTFDWQKNSIHADNCLGGYLTQDEIRDLADYCRAHGIDVIPEMPSLSHSDYLVMPHPELAERAEDPYPDTYCPQNPKSYELLFDLLEEVIEVVRPSILNIGHDEYYSIGLCERCRNIPAEELFAGDVIKLHGFLAERGIKTMMWGDKLQNITSPNYGCETGGAEIRRLSLTAEPKEYYIPATYKARDLIPNDIIVLNWTYECGRQHEEELLKRGFKVVFSNLDVYNVTEWKSRFEGGISGGFVSNWGSTEPMAMQRNGQIVMLLTAAEALWNSRYDSTDNDALFERVVDETVRWHERELKKPITVTHTTDRLMKKYVFHDGIIIEDGVWHIGDYRVRYTDGTEALLPVHYGYNISNKNLLFSNKNSGLCETVGAARPVKRESAPHKPVTYTVTWFQKPPEILDTEVSYEMHYTTRFENPHPDKEIADITYTPLPTVLRPDADDNPVVEEGTGVTVLDIKW